MYNGLMVGQIVGLSQVDSLHHLTGLLACCDVYEEVLDEHARSSLGDPVIGDLCGIATPVVST